MSSFAPGSQPLPWHFPVRNELMAALADLVVVIEARVDSGSLITAKQARQKGRPIAAFPGSPGTELALRAGAYPVRSVAEVLRLLVNLAGTAASRPADPAHTYAIFGAPARAPVVPAPSFINESTGEADQSVAVLSALSRVSALDLGELCARTGFLPGDCAAALVDLELRGRCTRLAGGRYILQAPLS